jgi:uncharacterized membrane protein
MGLRKLFSSFLERWAIFLLLISSALLYSLVGIFRHNHFGSFGFDLGIYDQAIWLYSRFKVPYSTIKGMIVLADHFSPTLILLAPLYWVWDNVKILLIFQAFIACLGAYPIYLLAKEVLKSTLFGLILAFAYLAYFGLQFGLTFDFHPVTVAAGVLAWLFYFLHRKQFASLILGLILLVGLKEDMPLVAAVFGLFAIGKYRLVRFGIISILLSSFYFFLVTHYFIPALSDRGFLYKPEIPLTPLGWWRAFTQPPMKLKTLLLSFLPLSFLPLLSPPVMILILAHFAENFPGTALLGRWGIFLHYRTILAPIMAVGTIFGINNLKIMTEKFLGRRFSKRIVGLTTLSVLVLTVLAQYGLHLPLNSLAKKDFYLTKIWMKDNQELLSKIPREASVATQNNLAPHLSHRKKIYMFLPGERDFSWTDEKGRVFVLDGSPCGEFVCDWLEVDKNAEYLLVDVHPGQPPANFWNGQPEQVKEALENMVKMGEFKILEQIGDGYLLRRI